MASVNAAASGGTMVVAGGAGGGAGGAQGSTVVKQRTIPVSFSQNHETNCDAATAELFYACNIPAAVVDHPKFKVMVATLKAAPPSYKPPRRHNLLGPLLDSTVSRLQSELGCAAA